MKGNETISTAQRPLQLLIAGGGTGGHIFPAVAIANAIRAIEPATRFLFVGAKGKMEMEKVPAAGYNIKGIDIAGFNRSSILKNLALPFKIAHSFMQVSGILNEFKPDAVIGVGGYSSFPVLRLAQARGIKTFIHESNSFAGKANILLGKKASKIYTAWPGMEKFFTASKIMQTGNPIRQVLVDNSVTEEAALHFFKLDQYKTTILSMGGSLGALNINETIDANIEEFTRHGLQLIWQTGKLYLDKARQRTIGMSNVYVTDFIPQMEYAYAAADIVISRSGAMAMAELCVVQKPVVFVPYPHAAEDHQTFNAKTLVDKGAAIMIANDRVSTDLVPAVINLAKNENLVKSLKDNIAGLGVRDADSRIATDILNTVRNS